MKHNFDQQSLKYHSQGKPGKVDVRSSKPCLTEYDLSLAYSPGVAAPCKEIVKSPQNAYKYTSKGNLVAVITNGSAVLGLGNIGPLAGKPVMEGKGVLFKQFADIDVFDLEIEAESTEAFISTVKSLAPTFGGINLEDIKAPECFVIEEALREQMNIPVFHDDQHGTAIISAAALLNACDITKKDLTKVKIVFNGAGAASIACAKLFKTLGVAPDNIIMCDSKGVIHSERKENINKYKKEFAIKTKHRTLEDAMKGSDVFCGLSVSGVLTKSMIESMAKNPIVFAMANPDPEIQPDVAKQIRDDIIIATGRSDFPNQVNNVLGFPSIFRGALDVQATKINEEMKLAAVQALAELARQDVPDVVSAAYDNKVFHYGPEYIIPKPFDPRVLTHVAPAVAKAAMKSNVAQKPIQNFNAYKEHLESKQSIRQGFVRSNINRVKYTCRRANKKLPRLIFPEGNSEKILKALNSIHNEKIIEPILLGYENEIHLTINRLELENLNDVTTYRPSIHPQYRKYVEAFHKMRHRKGVMYAEAERLMHNPYHFASMSVHLGDADGLISGATQNYADCVRPILEIIGTSENSVASGLIIILFKDKMFFLADTTVNINPTAQQLATSAIHASRVAKFFGVEPKVAMLSYSNFVSKQENPKKMKEASLLVKELEPKLIVDGEMQADTAVNPDIMKRIFPFCHIQKGANVLIFPNLDSGNIAYKLLQQLSDGEVLGPFLMGLKKPANILQRTCTVEDVINTIVLTAVETQNFDTIGF